MQPWWCTDRFTDIGIYILYKHYVRKSWNPNPSILAVLSLNQLCDPFASNPNKHFEELNNFLSVSLLACSVAPQVVLHVVGL